MLKFIEMEFFKLKNSKVFLLILLGSIAPAFLVHFGFSGRIDYGEKITFALLKIVWLFMLIECINLKAPSITEGNEIL